MAKRVKKWGKRLANAYDNYKRRYKAAQKQLKKRGYDMASEMMTKREYERIRDIYRREVTTVNINQTIVSDQKYEYSQDTARRFKRTAEEFGLEWKDMKITELRKGGIDVSAINNALKEMSDEELEKIYSTLPEGVAHTRQGYISYEVFGSV